VPDWLWFVILGAVVLLLIAIVLGIFGHQDLNKFNQELPKLPSIQEVQNDNQKDFRDR
jgi:hypothetical protein